MKLQLGETVLFTQRGKLDDQQQALHGESYDGTRETTTLSIVMLHRRCTGGAGEQLDLTIHRLLSNVR